MAGHEPRNISTIHLARLGSVREAPDHPAGFLVVDAAGASIAPINAYLRQVYANGNRTATTRSYGHAMLRWWRFLTAIEVPWDRATATEFIDFVLWMRHTTPRHGGPPAHEPDPHPGGFAPRTINHTVAVLTGFYDFHGARGDGPLTNPARDARPRHHEHHNPMRKFSRGRRGPGRQKVPQAAPKAIPDAAFDRLFARLGCERDRALIAFYVSSGARASELLGLTGADLDFGNHRIQVRRKGTGAAQWIPASPDSFVWLRLYLRDRTLTPDEPIWLTRRRPYRPLSYPACRQIFLRAQAGIGTEYTLHQLRHTAAYRMIEDPALSLTDVMWVLGHRFVTSTQIYITARPDEVLARMVEFYAHPRPVAAPPPPQLGYDPTSLDTIFGRRHG